ncbi:unnamed protein product [Allacma fusca]|uniref:Uncharacterized protein n=1 Tax=Allacma fusca TaxID=39272 RepID=A0A8J2L1V7_9HEXA|nr:unnamed protein product [Allacma fusca]
MSVELNSVKKCLSELASFYNFLRAEPSDLPPEEAFPRLTDNERNSKKILEEILIEIKAIKSKLVKKDKVGANISGEQKSHNSQHQKLSQQQLQVPDEDTHNQEYSSKSVVVSDEVLK